MYIGTGYNAYQLYTQYSSLWSNFNSSFIGSRSSGASSASSFVSQLLGNNSSSSLSETANKAVSLVTDLKSNAASLKNAVADLASGFTAEAAPASSDEDALTVSAGSGYVSGGKYSVTINQLATAQINEGASLDSAGLAGEGAYSFTLQIGGRTKTLSVSLGAGDTNLDMQNKMAEAINGSGLAVTATVEQNESSGSSKLVLTSDGTGDSSANVFRLSDVEGGLVALTGASNNKQEAQDAKYTVNGVSCSSSTNEVTLAKGLTATLKKVTSEAVTVSQGVDVSAAAGKVSAFVNAYNALYKTAAGNADNDSKTFKLFSQILDVGKTYGAAMAKVGLFYDEDGQLYTDDELLTSAIEDGRFERLFSDGSGSSYGLSGRLTTLANNVARNTGNYVGTESFGLSGSGGSSFDFGTYLNSYYNSLGYKYSGSDNMTGLLFSLSL